LEIGFFWKGVVLGFSIAAPVGPIGVLCIRRTLAEGHAAGFVSGLGAATADALYGGIAGFGLTLITRLLVSGQSGMQLIGGIFLCYLGIRTFLSRPAEPGEEERPAGLLRAYCSTLLLTLTNPMTILSFAAVFAGLGAVGPNRNYLTATLLVTGVFLGSALWWLLLSGGVGLVRSRFNPRGFHWINRLSGLVLFGFGLTALIMLVSRVLRF
jgi:threonine/homoserine/homoserine lactone efflux protein